MLINKGSRIKKGFGDVLIYHCNTLIGFMNETEMV